MVVGANTCLAEGRASVEERGIAVRLIPDDRTISVGEAMAFEVKLQNHGEEPAVFQSMSEPGQGFYRFEYRVRGGSDLWQVLPKDAAHAAVFGGILENLLQPGGEVSRRDFANAHFAGTASPPLPGQSRRGTIEGDLRRIGLEFVIPGEYEFFVTVRLRDASGSIYEVRSNVVPFMVQPISRDEADLIVELSKFRSIQFHTGASRWFDREFVCLLDGRSVPMYGRMRQLWLARLYMSVAMTDRDAREALNFYRATLASFSPSTREVLGDISDEDFNRSRTAPTYVRMREAYWAYWGEPRTLFPLRCQR